MTEETENEKVIPIASKGDPAHVKALIREMAATALDAADMPRTEAEAAALVPHFEALTDRAFGLIEHLDGNVEFARRICTAAFEEAERVYHNIEAELDELSG
jgi:hypothetical protein